MPFGNKRLESIHESDLQSLVDNQVLEGKTIEYKESLPGNTDSEKKEFLADVSSFANAAGVYLIFGIKQKSGVPLEVCGLQITNVDAEILRLENMIREGIEPRIPGIAIHAITLQNSKVAIIIRIPRSWALPHMVTFRGHSKFYSRNSAGKYPLDVSELRALFALSETTTQRIRNFRVERLGKIIAGEAPIALDKSPKIVLHIIPLNAFDPTKKYDLESLDSSSLQPINTSSWDHRYNFDGILAYGQFPKSTSAYSYLQIFRNGIIEAVETYLLREGVIPSVTFEEELLKALPRFLTIQKKLGVEPPLFIMLSLLEVSGYTIAADRKYFWRRNNYSIDRDTLVIPEILIESFECDPAEVMKPIFDTIWNAAGWPRSMNYDENGKWVGARSS